MNQADDADRLTKMEEIQREILAALQELKVAVAPPPMVQDASHSTPARPVARIKKETSPTSVLQLPESPVSEGGSPLPATPGAHRKEISVAKLSFPPAASVRDQKPASFEGEGEFPKPNLNEASRALIKRLCTGFGPVMAYRLVAERARGGYFTSWDDVSARSARSPLGFAGGNRMEEMKRRFSIFPVRNVNTASADELRKALEETLCRCEMSSCKACKNRAKRMADMEVIARIIVEEREFYGEFEDWENVEERVLPEKKRSFTMKQARQMLEARLVRCVSAAEEEAAAARARNLRQVFDDAPFVRVPQSRTQLEDCTVRKLMSLVEHYCMVFDSKPKKKKDLVDAILEEERRRAAVADAKYVSDIVSDIMGRAAIPDVVAELVSDIISKITGTNTASQRDAAADGVQETPVKEETGDDRAIISPDVRMKAYDLADSDVRVLGDSASLERMDTKMQLVPLALYRYGLDQPKSGRLNRRSIIQSILKYEREELIPKFDEKNMGKRDWRKDRVLSIGSWNMLSLSEATIDPKRGMERFKNLPIILDGLNRFDVVALLEVTGNDGVMKKICGELEEYSNDEWGWVQSRKSKPRANETSEGDIDETKVSEGEQKCSGEIVGFLWRKSKVCLTSSEGGDSDRAQTLEQDDKLPATSFFHRPPALARFQSRVVPEFRFVLVAAHITWGGFGVTRDIEARSKELRNLAGALECIREAEEKACVIAVGDFNMNPTQPAWQYLRDAGWDTHVRDATMVLSEHAYDNIVARGYSDPDSVPAGLPGHEFILEHPEKDRTFKARVGVLNMLCHMKPITEEWLESLKKKGHGASKNAITKSIESMSRKAFHVDVSDHLPVRMEVLLDGDSNVDSPDTICRVGGVNIASSRAKTTSGFDRYPVAVMNSGFERKTVVSRFGRRATEVKHKT